MYSAYNYGSTSRKPWWRALLEKMGIVNCKSSRYYYYEQLSSKYRCLESYTTLTQKGDKTNSLNTAQRIAFSDKIDFGASLKEFKQLNHELCHNFIDPLIPDSEVYLYRTRLGGHRVKLELHFYCGHLFMYNYSFSYLSKDQKYKILDLVQLKYGLDRLPSDRGMVKDSEERCFIVSENPELSISYFNPEDDFFNELEEAVNVRDQQRIKKEERRLQELLTSL